MSHLLQVTITGLNAVCDSMAAPTGLTVLHGRNKERPCNDITRASNGIKILKAEICVKNSLEFVLDDLDKIDAYSETTRNEYRHILGMFGKDARDVVLECYWLCNERRFNRLVQRLMDDE